MSGFDNGFLTDCSRPVNLASITCPRCGHVAREPMPADACVYFYACAACAAVLRPKPGDCCVFCSYGDRRCPPRGTAGGASQSQP